MTDIPFDTCLNAEGLPCPLPLLKTRLQLKSLAAGQVLLVTATDAGARRDIPRFLESAGHELLLVREDGPLFQFWIKKGST